MICQKQLNLKTLSLFLHTLFHFVISTILLFSVVIDDPVQVFPIAVGACLPCVTLLSLDGISIMFQTNTKTYWVFTMVPMQVLVHSRPMKYNGRAPYNKVQIRVFPPRNLEFFRTKKIENFFFLFPKNFHINNLKESHMVLRSLESPNKSRDSRDYENPTNQPNKLEPTNFIFQKP